MSLDRIGFCLQQLCPVAERNFPQLSTTFCVFPKSCREFAFVSREHWFPPTSPHRSCSPAGRRPGKARLGTAVAGPGAVYCAAAVWVGGGRGHHMESTPRHLLPTTTTHPPSGCLQAGVLVFVAGCAGSKKHLHGFPPPLPPAWVGGWRVTTPPTTTTRGQRGHTLRSCQNQKFRNLNSRQFSEIRP